MATSYSPMSASRRDHYKLTGVKVTDQAVETGPYTSDLKLEYMGLKCIGKKIHPALFMQGDTATKVRQLKEQCHLLSQVRHPNVAVFLGLFFQESPILVIEYVPYNLASCIEQYGILPNENSFSILHDIAVGLSYFHNQTPPIVHGDLCANNILLTSNMRAKIVYLGVTKILQLTQPEINYMAKTSGTSVYMSPEAITGNHENYSSSTDIFSFGIMVNHIMTGRCPELESRSNEAISITITFSGDTICNDTDDTDIQMKELAFRCTNESSILRPQTEELVKIFAGMVSKYPPSFINRLEMLNRIWVHEKLKIGDKGEERDLHKKVKEAKQRVLAQRLEMDRLTAENESLKQQLTSDDALICKTIADFQEYRAEQEQQNDKGTIDAQDLLEAKATGEIKQHRPKPKIIPRKKVPLRETHSAPNSPQSERSTTQTIITSPLVVARKRAVTYADTAKSQKEDIQLVTSIGRGRFFEVWEGRWNGTRRVAIKRMIEQQFLPAECLQDEVVTMKSLRHHNLVQFYSVSMGIGEPTCLIVELMEGGSLRDYLRGEGKTLQLSQLIEKAEQIAAGMVYLEEHNYIHQNLSSRNVLLTKDLTCKISDYGVIRLLKPINEEGSIPMRLSKRTAPEAFLYGKFTIKSDVWSYGIVLYEIITYGQLPYLGMSNSEVMQKLQEGYRMPCPENCQEKLYEIMLSCWKDERENRPTFETLRWQLEDYFNTDQEGYIFMKSKRSSIT